MSEWLTRLFNYCDVDLLQNERVTKRKHIKLSKQEGHKKRVQNAVWKYKYKAIQLKYDAAQEETPIVGVPEKVNLYFVDVLGSLVPQSSCMGACLVSRLQPDSSVKK